MNDDQEMIDLTSDPNVNSAEQSMDVDHLNNTASVSQPNFADESNPCTSDIHQVTETEKGNHGVSQESPTKQMKEGLNKLIHGFASRQLKKRQQTLSVSKDSKVQLGQNKLASSGEKLKKKSSSKKKKKGSSSKDKKKSSSSKKKKSKKKKRDRDTTKEHCISDDEERELKDKNHSSNEEVKVDKISKSKKNKSKDKLESLFEKVADPKNQRSSSKNKTISPSKIDPTSNLKKKESIHPYQKSVSKSPASNTKKASGIPPQTPPAPKTGSLVLNSPLGHPSSALHAPHSGTSAQRTGGESRQPLTLLPTLLDREQLKSKQR